MASARAFGELELRRTDPPASVDLIRRSGHALTSDIICPAQSPYPIS